MRYLGNKESIKREIVQIIKDKNLLNDNKVFFDAFCGTGTLADEFKDMCRIIVNDNLKFATIFAEGRLNKNKCHFKKLGFDPIEFLNNNNKKYNGFFTKNYSPKISGRMYFSDENAGRIDYFRHQIEEWFCEKRINMIEYKYLLGCLLESTSKVANIAGVYGAYLKTWDQRALKKIQFINIESNEKLLRHSVVAYNNNIVDIIKNVKCDVIYLDPPYTKNKYSVQYHILETLILNDNPKITGITGARVYQNLSNNWSIKNKVEIEFDKVMYLTKAKHIVLSYSDEGILSKEYIQNVFKRYCKKGTIEIKEIEYKKYRNHRTKTNSDHKEYIFYGEKKEKEKIYYCCPLNYMGGKSNIINEIKPYLNSKKKIIDVMGGGFNVGINADNFKKYYYNDINSMVVDIIKMFKELDTEELLNFIEKTIKKYGLEKKKLEPYRKLRKDYNEKYRFKNDYEKYLYVLILYGFQQQLRFNSKHEFNNTLGESGYNDYIKEKIVSFSRRIKELNVSFFNKSYKDLKNDIDKDTLLYVDPPYLITLGSYNDGKRGFNGWNEAEEKKLIDFFNDIKNRNCKMIISNILEYKGKKNKYLIDFIKKNKKNIKIKNIDVKNRKEVLIVYE